MTDDELLDKLVADSLLGFRVLRTDDLDELRAENERLREALSKVAAFEAWSMPDSYSDDAAEAMVEEIQGIAKAALKEGK